VHALVTAVLLGVTGTNAIKANAEAQPPDRKLREVEELFKGPERMPSLFGYKGRSELQHVWTVFETIGAPYRGN
jgi:hypothetical protein